MDKNRFDGFTRQLAQRDNRRQAIKTLLAGGAGTAAALMIGKDVTEAGKPPSTPTACCPADHPALCGLTCTAIATDPTNCGGCGVTCDASQTCVAGVCTPPPAQCKKVSDCASSNTLCRTATTCRGGVCGYSYVSSGTPVGTQTTGDCQTQVCDGAGNITFVAESIDIPTPENECYIGTCTGTTPGQRAKLPGARCTGGKCDGSGNCVECFTASDCTGEAPPNATVACNANICGYVCNSGYSDCADGCFNFDHDTQHCGSCDTVCSVDNGTASCIGGTCYVDICDPGFGDCNNDASDGCETNVNTDPNNCSACGLACSSNNGTAYCTNGVCGIDCAAGWGNCNGGAGSDGCETDLTTISNCGSCGNVCNLPNAQATCGNGICLVASCNTGYANCDGNPANGCEVNLQIDNNNCGACGHPCGTNTTCINGVCVGPAPE